LIDVVSRSGGSDGRQLNGPTRHREFDSISITDLDPLSAARHQDDTVTRAQCELGGSLAQHEINRNGSSRLDLERGFSWD
jgi:hypothetical protein